jgi:hypothetical protein
VRGAMCAVRCALCAVRCADIPGNLWHFIKKEEMPRNGVRNVLILNKLA